MPVKQETAMTANPRDAALPSNPTHEDVDAPHRPADDAEVVYYEGSPMLRAHIGRGSLWLLGGAVAIAIPILLHIFADLAMPWWAYAAGLAVGLVLIFVPWMQAKTVRYRISNYRIDFERGLLSKDIDTLELWHVEDIRFHQSILSRLLGVGTITVLSHDDTSPQLVLRGLPNPRPLFDSLKQRIIAVKRQRGVIKMDSGT
jgi:membrane protein YdbS with pleckstrin-like domain